MKIISLFSVAALLFLFGGCQNDEPWIKQRGQQLVGKRNPATGRPYTLAEANNAAYDENTFAKKAAWVSVMPNNNAADSIKAPASMAAHPSAQPAPMAPSAVACPTMSVHAH